MDRLPAATQRRMLDWVEQRGRSGPVIVGLATAQKPTGPLLEWLGLSEVRVAPLRERIPDLLPLARGLVPRMADSLHRPPEGLTPAAEDQLLGHRWPGNVRQLATVIERAVHRAAGGAIGTQHFDPPDRTSAPGWEPGGQPRPLREVADAYLACVLRLTGGNRTRAARLLGVARETLRTRIRSRAVAH